MIVEVRVSANSPKQAVEEMGEGKLKVRVKAKPVEGRANAEVVELLARHFGVPAARVRILRGSTSNRKTIEVIEQASR